MLYIRLLLPIIVGLVIETGFLGISFGITNMGHGPDDKLKDMKRLHFFVNNSIVALNNEDTEGALSNLLFASILGLSTDQRFGTISEQMNESVYLIKNRDTQGAQNVLTSVSRQLQNASR
jgi:hypothetical protein